MKALQNQKGLVSVPLMIQLSLEIVMYMLRKVMLLKLELVALAVLHVKASHNQKGIVPMPLMI